jgi:hypothetical protein
MKYGMTFSGKTPGRFVRVPTFRVTHFLISQRNPFSYFELHTQRIPHAAHPLRDVYSFPCTTTGQYWEFQDATFNFVVLNTPEFEHKTCI